MQVFGNEGCDKFAIAVCDSSDCSFDANVFGECMRFDVNFVSDVAVQLLWHINEERCLMMAL